MWYDVNLFLSHGFFLLSGTQFVKDHFNRCFTQKPNDYDCLLAEKQDKIVILSRYKETVMLSCHHYDLIGSVRGLICLRNSQKLSLWNPAIHQSKEFILPTEYSRDYMYQFGFGFDPVSDNYKVVIFSCYSRSATVYHSGSGLWIDISVPDLLFLKYREIHYVIVKDCPHWIFAEYTDVKHPEINLLGVWTAVSLIPVKFDAGCNEFKLLPGFNFEIGPHGENHTSWYVNVDMNDCLTLMVYGQGSSNSVVDIYYLDGKEGCYVWSKMYSIGPIDFHSRDWFVLLSQGFKYGGEFVYHDHEMFCCYDYKTNTIKRLISTTNSASPSIGRCFKYMPSLVFLEGMKSVHLTTRTRHTPGLCFTTPQRLINSLRWEN